MNVRAKFRVEYVNQNHYEQVDIGMAPVYSEDPAHENKAFWDATPTGSLTLSIKRDMPAAKAFEVGKEYYLDFTPAS